MFFADPDISGKKISIVDLCGHLRKTNCCGAKAGISLLLQCSVVLRSRSGHIP